VWKEKSIKPSHIPLASGIYASFGRRRPRFSS
jgi:hypothetical protein